MILDDLGKVFRLFPLRVKSKDPFEWASWRRRAFNKRPAYNKHLGAHVAAVRATPLFVLHNILASCANVELSELGKINTHPYPPFFLHHNTPRIAAQEEP